MYLFKCLKNRTKENLLLECLHRPLAGTVSKVKLHAFKEKNLNFDFCFSLMKTNRKHFQLLSNWFCSLISSAGIKRTTLLLLKYYPCFFVNYIGKKLLSLLIMKSFLYKKYRARFFQSDKNSSL